MGGLFGAGAPQYSPGVEMALGKAAEMTSAIRAASSMALDTLIANATSGCREAILQFVVELKQRVSEVLVMKFAFWKVLPWRLLGVFGHIVGKTQQAKEVVASSIAEFHELQQSGKLCRMHRSVVRFFRPGNKLAQQLQTFASTECALEELPELFVEVQVLAMCPLSERWVEGARKQTHDAFKNAEHTSLAGACARLRRSEALALLDDPSARHWFIEEWHKKNSMQMVLASVEHMKPSTEAALFSIVYGYKLETMFRDVTAVRKSVGRETETAGGRYRIRTCDSRRVKPVLYR